MMAINGRPAGIRILSRRICLVLASLCAGLLVAALAAPGIIRLHLHFLIGQLLHGVSGGKALFLLSFLIVFYLRLAFAREHRTGRSKCAILLFFAASTAGLLVAMASFLCYMRAYDLSVDWHSLHWRHGINSINHITHIHTSKSGLALPIELLGWRSLHSRFDTGAAYLGAVPAWLAVVIASCFVASCFFGLIAAPGVLQGCPRREALGVSVALGLAMATVSKSILDGGPLAYDAVAGLLAVTLLAMAGSKKEAFRPARGHWLLALLAVSLWAKAIDLVDRSAVIPQGESLLYRLSVYGLLLVMPRVYWAGGKGWRNWALLSICGVLAAIFAAQNARSELAPLWKAAPGTVVWYDFPQASRSGGSADLDSFATASRVCVHSGDSILRTYLSLGEQPNRVRRVSAAPRPEKPTGLYADLVILAMSTSSLELRSTPLLQLRRADVIASGNHPRLRLQVEFSESLGPVLYNGGSSGASQLAENERFMGYVLLDRYLSMAGVNEYILIPLAQYIRQ